MRNIIIIVFYSLGLLSPASYAKWEAGEKPNPFRIECTVDRHGKPDKISFEYLAEYPDYFVVGLKRIGRFESGEGSAHMLVSAVFEKEEPEEDEHLSIYFNSQSVYAREDLIELNNITFYSDGSLSYQSAQVTRDGKRLSRTTTHLKGSNYRDCISIGVW